MDKSLQIMPRFANGAELLDYRYDDNRDDYVILVKYRDQYVTARMGELTDKEWYIGRYFADQEKAYQNWANR